MSSEISQPLRSGLSREFWLHAPDGRLIVRICADGNVEVNPDFSLTEVSTAVRDAMKRAAEALAKAQREGGGPRFFAAQISITPPYR